MINRRRKLILNGYTARANRKWHAPSNYDRYRTPYLASLDHLVKGHGRRHG